MRKQMISRSPGVRYEHLDFFNGKIQNLSPKWQKKRPRILAKKSTSQA